MKNLTNRQREVYDFLVQSLLVNQRPPTIREIGEELGVTSPNGIKSHLIALEKKGYIQIIPGAARGIKITVEKGKDCPFCGQEVK